MGSRGGSQSCEASLLEDLACEAKAIPRRRRERLPKAALKLLGNKPWLNRSPRVFSFIWEASTRGFPAAVRDKAVGGASRAFQKEISP